MEITSIEKYIRTGVLNKQLNKVAEHYPEKRTILVDFKDVEQYSTQIADDILKNPERTALHFKEILLEKNTITVGSTSGIIENLNVGYKNIPTEYSPKDLNNICERHIGQLMRVEGVVAQITDKYPYMSQSHYMCNICDELNIIPQKPTPKGIPIEPSRCRSCGKANFRLCLDESIWGVAQVMVLLEKPDLLRAGQRPPALTIYLLDDLTREEFDLMDKIIIDGVLKVIPHKGKENKFQWYLHAYDLETIERGFDEIIITPEEETKILEMSQNPNLLDDISQSIAPTIYGHNELKKALVLQMLGGTEKKQTDAQRRHWINILAMTDPGVAKSIMANAICSIAPKAIYTTGSGAKVGGLTTTAEKEALSGEWIIKPGILPMASGGLVALDEFTMLEDPEMNALREAMEQGTVSSAKAGKNVRFKANTAIFACANPKTGRFDDFTNPIEQFGIPAPVISRFDVMFVIRDVKDVENDRKIAKAIFNAHTEQTAKPILDRNLTRKYIAYAKQNFRPRLDTKNPLVEQELEDFYVGMRKLGFDNGLVSATARQYEALIRLAEASAKLHLRKSANLQDVKAAEEIIRASNDQLSMIDGKPGIFDIDLVVTGKSKSEREKHRLIEVMISEQGKVNPDGCTDLDSLEEELGGDLTRDKLEKHVESLMRDGQIYMPRHGRYKLVGD